MIQIDPNFLDAVWPHVERHIARAVSTSNDPDADTSQIKLQIRKGDVILLVSGETLEWALTISFIDYPNRRVAHIGALGGIGAVTEACFSEVKTWCRQQGARSVQAWCDETRGRLYKRVGFSELCRVVRFEL